MKYDCDVIRDLLPLYADKACSERSRDMVEEHLEECPDCRAMVNMLLDTEIEESLTSERESVIDYGLRQFKRRAAVVGSAVSGAITLPVLIVAALILLAGRTVSWVAIPMAACLVLASLIAVPILVPEDKLFWTFCGFTASLLLLLGVTCLYTHGDWFWIASSAILFGLCAFFLPFLVRRNPLKRLIGGASRLLIVLGVDFALFFNMLNMIASQGRLTLNTLLFSVAVIAGIALVVVEIIRKGRLHR